MKYKTLLFDSDDTLLDFKAAERQALEKAMLSLSLPFNKEFANIYSLANAVYWKAFEKGEISKEEIYIGRFKLFLENINLDFNAEKLSHLYESFLKKQFDLIDGAKDICESLYGIYDMYIVSNGNVKVQLPRLDGSGLRKYFKDVFVSEKVGCGKPKKEFFDYVFKAIGVTDKSKVLIIGDSISSDILGGINAGIDTCLFGESKNISEIKPTYTVKNHKELKKLLLNSQGDK